MGHGRKVRALVVITSRNTASRYSLYSRMVVAEEQPQRSRRRHKEHRGNTESFFCLFCIGDNRTNSPLRLCYAVRRENARITPKCSSMPLFFLFYGNSTAKSYLVVVWCFVPLVISRCRVECSLSIRPSCSWRDGDWAFRENADRRAVCTRAKHCTFDRDGRECACLPRGRGVLHNKQDRIELWYSGAILILKCCIHRYVSIGTSWIEQDQYQYIGLLSYNLALHGKKRLLL